MINELSGNTCNITDQTLCMVRLPLFRFYLPVSIEATSACPRALLTQLARIFGGIRLFFIETNWSLSKYTRSKFALVFEFCYRSSVDYYLLLSTLPRFSTTCLDFLLNT